MVTFSNKDYIVGNFSESSGENCPIEDSPFYCEGLAMGENVNYSPHNEECKFCLTMMGNPEDDLEK